MTFGLIKRWLAWPVRSYVKKFVLASASGVERESGNSNIMGFLLEFCLPLTVPRGAPKWGEYRSPSECWQLGHALTEGKFAGAAEAEQGTGVYVCENKEPWHSLDLCVPEGSFTQSVMGHLWALGWLGELIRYPLSLLAWMLCVSASMQNSIGDNSRK